MIIEQSGNGLACCEDTAPGIQFYLIVPNHSVRVDQYYAVGVSFDLIILNDQVSLTFCYEDTFRLRIFDIVVLYSG